MIKKKELEKQINKLAKFIINNVEGEPSQSQGAVNTAIRIIKEKSKKEKFEEEFEDKIYLMDEDYEWCGVPNFVNNELESLLITYFGVKRVIYTNGGIKGVSPRIPVRVKVRKGKIVIERVK